MSLVPGTRLGPYVVSAPIGSGGMGEVYKATDARLDRTVAVKVLPAHVAADRELRQRFEREAKALAALSHPHICPVYDVGSQEGIDFLVMEYLEGETLAGRLAEGGRVSRLVRHSPGEGGSRPAGLPLDQALQIAIQIADALDKAHRKGIVHRDLKPGNIFLVRSGGARAAGSTPPVAKLLDFGLAKLVVRLKADTTIVVSGFSRTSRPRRRSACPSGRLRAGRSPARARCSARFSTWPRSSSKARRPMRAPTSSRSARSSTRW